MKDKPYDKSKQIMLDITLSKNLFARHHHYSSVNIEISNHIHADNSPKIVDILDIEPYWFRVKGAICIIE